jgi:fructose-1-phosphate kinase PfkB-like protein
MVIRTLTLNPCLDVFYRLPRLVPGEVNRADEPTPRAGGKGVNVSREVLCQGMQTCAYVLFAGENGRRLASLLDREGIHFVAEWVEGETRTNLAIATDAESYKINTHGPDGAAEGAAPPRRDIRRRVPRCGYWRNFREPATRRAALCRRGGDCRA